MLRLIATALVAAMIWSPASAEAAAPEGAEPRPRLVVARWSTEPLTAGATEIVELTAVDPDGVPTVFWVNFGDGFVFNVDILCAPNTPPGSPMTTRLTHTYAQPGEYRVRAIATSYPTCSGGTKQRGIGRGVPTVVGAPLG